ncbi:NAD-binding protein [Sulfurimonas sp. HSL-3221]|uniref:potassium channel family protein n=1 Tax=Sulfurimonadaceae TaxID=2771471 RepID=UPI001E2BFCF3|nr:NAD-binding protein [Sulfurimonas sp. HSL-3221]UFS61304.1 NAD-binding protein [Sulfurimonas sp. HSL-3221]
MDNTALFLIIRRLRVPMFVLITTFGISILGMVLIPGVDEQGQPYHLTFFDAFYFVTYTASTIGFGETPYSFTYPQRLWVSFSIYLSVIGWFYAIGAIVALMQDKVLASQIDLSKFKGKIHGIREPFIIFVGYNLLAKSIIRKLSDEGIQSVVIENDAMRIDEMVLANYTLEIPALHGDINDPDVLRMAGINKPECQAVVSLSSDDAMNLHTAMAAKLLNPHVKVIVEATYEEYAENLNTIGIEIVENPFKIVAKRLYMGLRAPSLLMLEQWIYGEPLQLHPRDMIPTEGKYIVCGYGRMGKALRIALKRAGIEYVFIETNPKKVRQMRKDDVHIMVGEGQDKKLLLDAGVKEASCIIAGMNDDFINLSIVMAAKKLNPNIFTVARQNNIHDDSVFKAADIDRVTIVKNLLINQTYIAIARPLSERFLQLIKNKGAEWGDGLIITLKQIIGDNPDKLETVVDEEHAYALCRHLEKGETAELEILLRSRKDHRYCNRAVALYLRRGDEDFLLPDPGMPLQIGDQLLFAGDRESFEDIAYSMENLYELQYVLEGKSCATSVSCRLHTGR